MLVFVLPSLILLDLLTTLAFLLRARRMSEQTSLYAKLKVTEHLVRNRLILLPRRSKQALMILSDGGGVFSCVLLAHWLLYPGVASLTEISILAAATFLITGLLAWRIGFYHSIVRYLGLELAYTSIRVVIASAATLAVVAYVSGMVALPARLAVAYAVFLLTYLLGGRHTAQYFLVRRNKGQRLIIYGAGESGAQAALAMQNGHTFLPVAFVDDDVAVHNEIVSGLRVHPRDDLGEMVERYGVSRVLLAMPNVSRRLKQDIIAKLEPLGVHLQTIPDFNDLVTGKARVEDIRDIDVEDLLGREAVPPDQDLLKATVSGKTVMVTGAGGSIGSELCRQILRQRPKLIVLFEISEAALYVIEKEMRKLSVKLGISCDVVALLGSVHHEHRVREIMQTFGVNTVYHTAAYKHVPVVEQNLLEGVHNNIFGTLHTATAAIESNVDTFVLISTDKAVSPTNIMGATKRIAEMVLQALQDEHPSVCFCMVRFGNVLESSGSVVPLFREQIRAGGPVTVTHRDIIRYFMTIPEAAQLVIQAGAMATGGDLFVLDMGEPIKIHDLARRMIPLMGLTVRDEDDPEGDIEIEFTGLRPAEKLYEELLIGSDVSGTRHPLIMRANEEYLKYDVLSPLLESLRLSSAQLDRDRARQLLLETVAGYKPGNSIDDHVWVRQNGNSEDAKTDTVVDFPKRSA